MRELQFSLGSLTMFALNAAWYNSECQNGVANFQNYVEITYNSVILKKI